MHPIKRVGHFSSTCEWMLLHPCSRFPFSDFSVRNHGYSRLLSPECHFGPRWGLRQEYHNGGHAVIVKCIELGLKFNKRLWLTLYTRDVPELKHPHSAELSITCTYEHINFIIRSPISDIQSMTADCQTSSVLPLCCIVTIQGPRSIKRNLPMQIYNHREKLNV